MKIIELFSGIGGFTKGFMDAGFQFSEHYFSEIDKHAIANYKNNFPNAKHIGSVVDIRPKDFKDIDIITFGSPCQDFSLAGKRKGLGGERSSLIEYAIRLVNDIRPSFFIWENVKGAFSSNNSEDFWAIIQTFTNIGGYRLEWQLLNTKWFLPQNRERIYLIGHLAAPGRSFNPVFPIAENSFGTNERAIQAPSVRTLTAGGNSGGLHSSMTLVANLQGKDFVNTIITGGRGSLTTKHSWDMIKVKSATKEGFEIAHHGDSINLSNVNSDTRRGRVGNGIAQTLDCACNQCVFVGSIRGRYPENPKSREVGLPTQQMLEINQNGVSNTLTSVQKDNVVIHSFTRDAKGKVINRNKRSLCNTITSATGGGGSTDVFVEQRCRGNNKGGRFDECPTISANSFEHNNHVNSIRRLTEIECERLQGFPDNWTKYGDYDGVIKEIPKTQRYKMLGNAVTVKVVEHIAKKIKESI